MGMLLRRSASFFVFLTLSLGQPLSSSLFTLLTNNSQTGHIRLGLICLALLMQLPVLLLGGLLLSSLSTRSSSRIENSFNRCYIEQIAAYVVFLMPFFMVPSFLFFLPLLTGHLNGSGKIRRLHDTASGSAVRIANINRRGAGGLLGLCT